MIKLAIRCVSFENPCLQGFSDAPCGARVIASNASIIPRKRTMALSQSSPQGTRVFASGNSDFAELLGEAISY